VQNQNSALQSSALKVTCVFGEDVKNGFVRPFEFQSLRGFAGWLKGLQPVNTKEESEYIVGANFSGNQRTLRDITGATIIQMDFDKPVAHDHQGAVLAILESLGVGNVAFDTFSNGGRFVVLIPLSRPATPAEHRATLNWLVGELGVYAAGLDQASFNPVLPRFVSPNANNETRTITLFDGPILEPIHANDDTALPSNVTSLVPSPIPAKPAVVDRFALYTEQATPEEQQLFLVALRHNLLPEGRLAEYPQWFPVVFACFRAWAVNSRELTQVQQEMWEALDGWSKRHPKWKPDALKTKLNDWLRDRGQGASNLHIQSMLSHEINPEALRLAIRDEGAADFDGAVALMNAADKVLGGVPVNVIDNALLEAAATKRKMQEEADAALRLRGLTFIARAPLINERFTRFIDLLTAASTQNKAEFWELNENEWNFFLRPAPMLIGLCQMYAMGFAPHAMFRLSEVISPKALNLYFLNIAPAGTGKSETIKIIHQVLAKTTFKNLSPSYKLHSATGLWINAFERHGPLQLVTSDEAESLIGKQNQRDQHLLALQTSVKQLHDEGMPGRKFRPSAQVQRELREITAPHMSLNLGATPTLLREDIGAAMLNDGFVSRMIVSVDDRVRGNETFEESVQKKIDLITSTTNATQEGTTNEIVKFFIESWRCAEAHHPAGREFFSVMGDEPADDLAGKISAHFERTDLVLRYITPPKTPEGIRKFSEILANAVACWPVPLGMRGTDAEANIESLRVRAETKLCVLASILTLVANPGATEVDLRIMEWAADILYTCQYPFYKHLLNTSDASGLTKSRLNPGVIGKLQPALLAGAPLGGGVAQSAELRNFSRPWRKLINDLKYDGNDERHRAAEEALETLEVGYRKVGKSIEFFVTKGLEHE